MDFEKINRIMFLSIFVLFLILLVYSVLQNLKARNRPDPPDAYAKAHLHTIQIALENYAQNNKDHYPETIANLIQSGFLDQMPDNHYANREMQNISFTGSRTAGDFTYFPVYFDDEILGHYLLVYGEVDEQTLDVTGDDQPDQVIMVLSNVSLEGVTLPPLEDLLIDAGQQSENREE